MITKRSRNFLLTMKTKSLKAKGRRLQGWFRDKLLEKFPDLDKDDVRSTSMGANGEDILLSSSARENFPFAIECKNQEQFSNVYTAYDQAVSHIQGGKNYPLLVIKINHRRPLIVIDVDDFFDYSVPF